MKELNDEIIPIIPPTLPFELDDKVFQVFDDDGIPVGHPYSYNDHINEIINMSGVNPKFLGTGKEKWNG